MLMKLAACIKIKLFNLSDRRHKSVQQHIPFWSILLYTEYYMQVVDNSSAFRMQEGVPLVIPEVNPEAMKGMKAGKGGIIANPNCSTIIALMAVTPLHRAAGVKRMVVSTYQVQRSAIYWIYWYFWQKKGI